MKIFSALPFRAASNEVVLSRNARKPDFGVSDLVLYKSACVSTDYGWRLEFSDLGRRGIVLSV